MFVEEHDTSFHERAATLYTSSMHNENNENNDQAERATSNHNRYN